MNKPDGCRVTKPTRSSILFGGIWINVSAIARTQGMKQSFVSKIMSGSRGASVTDLRRVANAIGFGLEELLDAIELRRIAIQHRKEQTMANYNERVKAENIHDAKLANKGLPVPPRMTSFRLPQDTIPVK